MNKHLISALLAIVLTAVLTITYIQLSKVEETPPIWSQQLDFKVYSDPIYSHDNFYLVGGDKGTNKHILFELNQSGEIIKQTPNLPATPYEPIPYKKHVILADAGRKVRAFTTPGLNITWELGADEHFKVKPIKLSEEKLLIMGNHKTLFCVDVATGEPEWDSELESPVVSYAVGEYIICLHPNPNNPASHYATAINPNDGALAWRITEVSKSTPLVAENIFILTTDKNQTIIVDQKTGMIMFKNPDTKFAPVKIFETHLLALSKDKTNLMVTSLETGNAWEAQLQTSFQDAVIIDNSIFIAEKKYLYAKNLENGKMKWRLKLNDIYNLYKVNNGVFATYKEYFTARITYGSLFDPVSSEPIWTTVGEQLFMKPVSTERGDFVVSYNGKCKLLPNQGLTSSTEETSFELPNEGRITDPIMELKSNKSSILPTNDPKKSRNRNEIFYSSE
jgi:outer membrane protein assembly factor BamB